MALAVGDAVFTSDSARIGRLDALDDASMVVRDGHHTYHLPRDEVAYESEDGGRVFLKPRNRSAMRRWRGDLRGVHGLRAWIERRVLAPSPKWVGGHLYD